MKKQMKPTLLGSHNDSWAFHSLRTLRKTAIY